MHQQREVALGLEIPEIGGIDPPGVLLADSRRSKGGGTCLRVSGAVKAADTSGKNNGLPHGHGGGEAEGPVGLSHREAVFIQGGHVFIKGVGRHFDPRAVRHRSLSLDSDDGQGVK